MRPHPHLARRVHGGRRRRCRRALRKGRSGALRVESRRSKPGNAVLAYPQGEVHEELASLQAGLRVKSGHSAARILLNFAYTLTGKTSNSNRSVLNGEARGDLRAIHVAAFHSSEDTDHVEEIHRCCARGWLCRRLRDQHRPVYRSAEDLQHGWRRRARRAGGCGHWTSGWWR
ncbi:protein of unknown function [Nitratireductor aquimarinus]